MCCPESSVLLRFSLLISMSSFNQQIVTKCLPLAPLCDIKVNVMVSVPNLQVILDIGFTHSLQNWLQFGCCFVFWCGFVVLYFVFVETGCCSVAQAGL